MIYRYSIDGNQYGMNDDEDLQLVAPRKDINFGSAIKQVFNCTKKTPTYLTQKVVTVQVFIFSKCSKLLLLYQENITLCIFITMYYFSSCFILNFGCSCRIPTT